MVVTNFLIWLCEQQQEAVNEDKKKTNAANNKSFANNLMTLSEIKNIEARKTPKT